MFGKSDNEPSFKEAVRKIAQEEFKDYSDLAHRLEGEMESLRKGLEALDGKSSKSATTTALEQKVRDDLSEMRKNFSKTISEQETKIVDIQKLMRSLEERMDAIKSGGGKPVPTKAVDNISADMKTLEKTVFEQFDQIRKSVDDLSMRLTAKSRDIDSVMSMLNRFQDEARALSSENFIKDMGTMKLKINKMEKEVTELEAREPVVIE